MKKSFKRLLSATISSIMLFNMTVGVFAQSADVPKPIAEESALILSDMTMVSHGNNFTKTWENLENGLSDQNRIRVKTPPNETVQYYRKALLKFTVPEGFVLDEEKNAYLDLHIALLGTDFTSPSKDPTAIIYKTVNEWSSAETTFETFPARVSGAKTATLNKSSVKSSSQISVDITELLYEAISANETTISLEISMTQANSGENGFEFFSGKDGASNAPSISFIDPNEIDPNPPKATEEQLLEMNSIREKWVDYIVGADAIEEALREDATLESNPNLKAFTEKQNETSSELWNTLNKDIDITQKTDESLWEDTFPLYKHEPASNGKIDHIIGGKIGSITTETRLQSSNITRTYSNLLTLAIAYYTPTNDLYQNEEVKTAVLDSLEFMNLNYYNGTDVVYYGNWWNWEIGAPTAMLKTIILFYDDYFKVDEKGKVQLEKYVEAVNRFTDVCNSPSGYSGSPSMTGANLLDKAVSVALVGLLTDNPDKLDHIKNSQKSVYKYVTDGDGFYEDGSFIQHSTLAYIGGYGSVLFGKTGLFFYMLDGTEWEIKYDDQSEEMIYDAIFNSIEPLIFDLQVSDMASGRGIVRADSSASTRGVGTLRSLLLIGETMTGEQKTRYESMMKYHIGQNEELFYSFADTVKTVELTDYIMSDAITARDNYEIHKTYSNMDRVSHVKNNYSYGISMSSSRTDKFEQYNSEGRRLWNIADGMTYIHTNDVNQFGNGFWATIDPHRLPGTTVENAPDRQAVTGNADYGMTPYSWAGGATLDIYGVAGLQLKSYGSGLQLDGAHSKKSWFMFDDEIVALGTDIKSSTGNVVETIIDNRQIGLDLSNIVTVDGGTPDLTSVNGTELTDIKWVNIEGNTENSSIGYYFPAENTTIKGLKEKRDSNWITQGPTDQEVSGSYATLWFDHGTNSTNESYEYVVLPDKDVSETEAYSASPDIEVLINTPDVQAVKETNMNMTGVNFWNDEVTTGAGITSNKKASVIMQVTEDNIILAVSDPTQTNNGTIEITLSLPWTGIVSTDGDVVTNGNKIIFDVKKKSGATQTITLERDKNASDTIIGSVDTVSNKNVEIYTPFSDLNLPTTTSINTPAGSRHQVDVIWNEDQYKGGVSGVYNLLGTLKNLPDGISNPDNIAMKIQITVVKSVPETGETGATMDASVRDATYKDENYGGQSWLPVGRAGARYRTAFQFNIESMPMIIDEASLDIFLRGSAPDNIETIHDVAVYLLEDNWQENTITWNNFPKKVSDEAITTLTVNEDELNTIIKFDVTSAVQKAIEEGKDVISLEIYIPKDVVGKNYLSFSSKEDGDVNRAKPALSWSVNPENKDDLSLAIETANTKILQAGLYTHASIEFLKSALANSENVLWNRDATQNEIDASLVNLMSALENLVESSSETSRPRPTDDDTDVDIEDGETPLSAGDFAKLEDISNHWGEDAIKYVVENALMNGISDTEFAPNLDMSRVMIWTVLYRLDGNTDESGDVWYEKAMVWAMGNEISDGTNPMDSITREQLVTMLWRNAGKPVLADYTGLTNYSDISEVDLYAQSAFAWAHQKGFITGKTEDILDPNGFATRAEVATILERILKSEKG